MLIRRATASALPKLAVSALLAIAAILLIAPACRHEGGAGPGGNRELAPVTLNAGLDPKEATIGDRITVTLSQSRMPEIVCEFPEPSAPPDGFTPIESGHSRPLSEGGRITEKKWTTYRADRVGTWIFPSVSLRYRRNGADNEARSQALTLEVKSVLPRDMSDIHGLKPLELPKRNVLLLLAVASLLMLSAAGAWLLWRKRTKPAQIQPGLLPHLEAEQRLRELEAMGLLARGDFKKYFFLLSEIFRIYLERRFAFPAVERTPEEILVSLDALELTNAQKDEIRLFLRATEPVKFAGAGCSTEEAAAETDRVRRVIAATWRKTPEEAQERQHVAV